MAGLWPAFNASLNATSGLLLVAGFLFIRRRQITAHTACMSGALGVSALFFISYILYHLKVGSVHFQQQGWVRAVYFSILVTHTILAVTIVPLALRTVYLSLVNRLGEHKRLARWTLPLWLYVCASGVVVYWMLYRL